MSLARNIASTLSTRFAMMFLALASSILLARGLGPEGRGLFALVILLPEIATQFGMFGYEQASAVYSGLKPECRRALFWQLALIALFIGGGITAGVAIYIHLGAPGFHQLLRGPKWLYLLYLAVVPARIAAEYWGALLRGMNRIHTINVLEVVSKVASLVLLAVTVLWLKLGVAGAVWSDSIVFIATSGVIAAILVSFGVVGRPKLDKELARRTSKFALPAYGGSILTYLNYRVDQVVLAFFVPPEQLAFYVIAVGLAERIWLPTGAVATALLPHLTNAKKRDPKLSAMIARNVLLWTGAACLVVFVLAHFVIRLLYSSQYEPAASALRWILPGVVTYSVGKVLVAELMAREKITYTIWVGTIAAGVNLGFNLLLVRRMGINGASLASTISYTAMSLLIAAYFVHQTGVSWMELIPNKEDFRGYARLLKQWRTRRQHQVLPVEPMAVVVKAGE